MSTSASPPALLTSRQVRAGLRYNIVAGCSAYVWLTVVFGMPLTMLLEAMGASGALMGLTHSLRQTAMVLMIPGALLAEFASRRKPTWMVLTLLQRLLWFLPAFALLWRCAPATIVAATILATTAGAALDSLAASAWHSWMADLVPEPIRGEFWSTRSAFAMAAMLAATLLSGIVLDKVGAAHLAFGILFLAAAVAGTADVLIHARIPEPPPGHRLHGESIAQRILRPLRDRNFRCLTLAIGVWTFSVNSTLLNQVYLKQVFHVTYFELSLVTICASVGAIGAGILFSRVIDRVGARPFLIVMMSVAPAFGIFWFVVTGDLVTIALPGLGLRSLHQATLILATQSLISGGLYSGVGLGHLTLLGSLSPREGRTLAMAAHWTVVGLLGAAGPLCAGFLADFFTAHPSPLRLFGGTQVHFVHAIAVFHVLLVWTVGLRLLGRIRTPAEPSTVGDAFANLVMVNPLRFASGLFYLRQLAAPSSPRHRARSVLKLGRRRARLAVADLVRQLDDPDVDVREAAVESLGRIGTTPALDALLRRLEDPQTDLAAPILRTLRRIPDRRSVDALLRFLAESDRELVRESARALGATGDSRAVVPLLGLLRRTTDDTVAEASSDALARLGDIAAIFEILPRMRRTANPVLRRSLAVAVGNLLGRRDELYRILAAEERSPGAGFEELFRSLRARIRRLQTSGGASLPAASLDVAALEERIEAAAYAEAACETLRLARALAALEGRRNRRDAGEVYVDVLVWKDQRFAVGYWFLCFLASEDNATPEAAPAPDRLEALLALYALDGWARHMAEPQTDPAPGLPRPRSGTNALSTCPPAPAPL